MGGATLVVVDLSCSSSDDDSDSSAPRAESISLSAVVGDDGGSVVSFRIRDGSPPRPPRPSRPPPSPRTPLRNLYVGALPTIVETPKLDGSLVDPAANRRSASLTLPVSTHKSLLREANGKPRQRKRNNRRPPKGEWQEVDLWSDDSSCETTATSGTGSGVLGDSDLNAAAPSRHSDENEKLIVDFPHNRSAATPSEASSDLNGQV